VCIASTHSEKEAVTLSREKEKEDSNKKEGTREYDFSQRPPFPNG
jgi:hypothetical protein